MKRALNKENSMNKQWMLGLVALLSFFTAQQAWSFGIAGSTMEFDVNDKHFTCVPLEKSYPEDPFRFTGVKASISTDSYNNKKRLTLSCGIYHDSKRGPSLSMIIPGEPGSYNVSASARQPYDANSYHYSFITFNAPPESVGMPSDYAENGFISTSNQRGDIAQGDSRGTFKIQYQRKGNKVVGTFEAVLHVFDTKYDHAKKYGSPPKYLVRNGFRITNGTFSIFLPSD